MPISPLLVILVFANSNLDKFPVSSIVVQTMVHIIGIGEKNDPQRIPLVTRKGSQVPNAKRIQYDPSHFISAVEMFQKKHPSLEVRSLCSEYNCIGLVFASRRTVIDEKHLPMLLSEDRYRKIPREDVIPGDLVVYRNEESLMIHVGIVLEKQPDIKAGKMHLRILSQWGADGEFIHFEDDIHEYLGTPSDYWTERVE